MKNLEQKSKIWWNNLTTQEKTYLLEEYNPQLIYYIDELSDEVIQDIYEYEEENE